MKPPTYRIVSASKFYSGPTAGNQQISSMNLCIPLPYQSCATVYRIWLGTENGVGENCNSWTSDSAAMNGLGYVLTGGALQRSAIPCNTPVRLLCVSTTT